MSDVKVEEYRILRQEHEMNRRFAFERPLLIVVGTLAVGPKVGDEGQLTTLLASSLFLLLFNLWFTFNRMASSARIVAYLGLVHEGTTPILSWLGWENSLRAYRQWAYNNSVPPRGLPSLSTEGIEQFDSLQFFGALHLFHLITSIAVSLLLALRIVGFHLLGDRAAVSHELWRWVVASLLLVPSFVVSFKYRPSKIRYGVELNRRLWLRILEQRSSATSA